MAKWKLARLKVSSYLLAGLLLSNLCIVANGQQPAKPRRAPDVQQLMTAAEAAQNQGRLDEAIQIYNRIVSISANAPVLAATSHLRIGGIYMSQRKFENAVVAFQKAVALQPSSGEAFNNLGEAQGELKQFPKAIEAFNRAVTLDPKLLKARYNQGVTYDRMRNFKYSEFVFKSLIKQAPQYSLAYDGLAITLSKSGRPKEAIPFHEKAISLDPKDPSFYFNLGVSYLMLGNTPKALEQQEKLKVLDPRIADQLASVIVKRQL